MARDKGYLAKIGADVSGFQEALKTIKQETSSIKKELSQVNHALKMDPGNTTLMTQKLELLKQQADAAEKELAELTRAKQVMERVGNDGTQEGAAALREYQREVERCKRHIQDFNNYQQQMGNSSDGMSSLANGADNVAESLSDATGATNNWAGVLKGNLLSGVIMQGLQQLLDLVKQIGTEMLNTGMSFDSAMSQVAATFGIDKTTEEYNALAVASEHMGATTKYTAAQASEALNYLALAGYSVKESIADLPQVLNLAQAGGMDLGRTSDLLTDSMSALGLATEGMTEQMKADAMRNFSDQLARTAQKANTDIEGLAEGILTVGATARGLKDGTAELNTLLGVLADVGIKGSEGGTHLRNVIKSLQENSDVFEKMGVDIYDLNGNMNYIPDIIAQMDDALSGLSEEEKNGVISNLFNKTDLAAVNSLLGTSAERFAELNSEIHNAEGTCVQMAATMNDNLEGAVTSCTSAWEGFSLAIYGALNDDMQGMVKNVTGILTELKEGLDSDEESIFDEEKMQEYADNIGNFVLQFADNLKEKLNTLGMELLPALLEGITANIRDMTSSATDVVFVFVKGLINALPDIVDGGVQLVSGLIDGIGKALPELLPVCLRVIGEIVENLVNNVDVLYDAIMGLVEYIGEALINPKTFEELAVLTQKLINAFVEACLKTVEISYHLIFDIVVALVQGIARGITEYDWSTFADNTVNRMCESIQQSLQNMTEIRVPFSAEPILSQEDYEAMFGKSLGEANTSTLGQAYLDDLKTKTKAELEQMQRDILIERNEADAAWAEFIASGNKDIADYLNTAVITDKRKAILQSIVDTAKASAIAEEEAYKELYSSAVLDDGTFSKSYLQFLAAQDVIVDGTYATPVLLKSGTVTKAATAPKEEFIPQTTDHMTFSFSGTMYEGDIEREMQALDKELEQSLITTEQYYIKRRKVLQEYYETKSDLWQKYNEETEAYFEKQALAGQYDDIIENKVAELDHDLGIHDKTEDEYYAALAEHLKQYVDEESLIYWKYKDEVDEYYAKKEEEAAKAAEEAAEEEEKRQKELTEQRNKQLKEAIADANDKVKEGKSDRDIVLMQTGIAELQALLSTISTESDIYEDCLDAIEDGNKEITELRKTLSDEDMKRQEDDIEYRLDVNKRKGDNLAAVKQYYDELKAYIENIQGTEYYAENERNLEKKLWSAEDNYKSAYLQAYKDDVQSQIDILDSIKADFEDDTLGSNWYLEQLQNIIAGIDNADVAEAFASQIQKAQETVEKNADNAEKAIVQAAEKYHNAIQYFRDGETIDGKDSLIINDLTKQREQIRNVISGMQALRDRGFTEAYLNDAVEPLNISDGSRQKAIEALLGLSEEQIQQELEDYEGLKADMLELARVENDKQGQEIADSAVLTANNALSKAVSEAYKIGQSTADAFNKGLLDGLGSGLNAQQALTAQGIDVLKSANSTVNAGNTVVTEKPNTTVVVNVAGTEVIRKTVDGMLRENIISGGNNLHI